MLSSEDNELMCRVGRDTPMGQNLRRYWWPVLLSSDLPARGRLCAPRRIRLMGEDLVAFRGEDGAVRIVGERCPHRGASMVLGVVEGCAIRCLFHGWLLDGDGAVVEAPNVKSKSGAKGLPAVKNLAYPAREAGGVIWTYAGPAETRPPFPDYRFFATPDANRWVSIQIADANFAQVVEGSLDPAHLAVLHQDSMRKTSVAVDPSTTSNVLSNLAPRIDIEKSEFGFRIFTVRKLDEENYRVRPTLYVAPTSVFIPRSPRATAGGLIMVTPIDDYRTMQMLIMWDEEQEIGLDPIRSEMQEYFGVQEEVLSSFGIDRDNCDRPGRPSLENGFLQDRRAIAAGESFTGIPDFVPEDFAMAMSQGRIADRSAENLVKSDVAVVEFRRSLIASARRVQQGGAAAGQDGSVDTYGICAHEYIVPLAVSWKAHAPCHTREKASRQFSERNLAHVG